MGNIRKMLNPQSVALIGATDREGSIGRAVLTNLLKSTDRPIYLINPNRQTALDLPCLPHIGDAPSPVSLAVIVTPAGSVPRLVEECGKAVVAGIIILSAGFGEAGTEGKRLEEEIVEIRKRYGMRIIGPNCLGVMIPHIGLNATFVTTELEQGNIALISQSGALGDAILDWGTSTGIGFRMFVSLGSMIDVGFGDIIDFLNDDYDTKSIMMYMENVGNARRFISAARGFALKKPIVVLKPGRYAESARAITSHTGGRKEDDRVYDAVFKRIGLVRVKEVIDLLNVAQVLDSRYLPQGRRLAIVTNSGGVGIIATDTLAELGGELARLSSTSMEKLNSFLPEQTSKENPVDIVADADLQLYLNTVEVCVGDEGVDAVLVIYTPRATADAIDLAMSLVEISRKTEKPIIAVWMGGQAAAEGRRILLQANLPAYATPEEAVNTYLYMYRYRKNIELLYETPAEVGQASPRLQNYLKAIVRNLIKEKKHTLSTKYALDLLMSYRIPTAQAAVVTDMRRISEEARSLGFPLSFTWKNLDDGSNYQRYLITEEDLAKACEEAKQMPDGITEIVLQKSAKANSYPFGLRSKRDPDFRTVIMLIGQGEGTTAEPISIGLPPLNQILARRLLEEAGIYRIITGAGGENHALAKLEESLVGFSNLVVDFPEIESIELVLSFQQANVTASNVNMTLAAEYSGSFPYPHLVITPYPSRYTQTWNLPDGTEVTLRPIRPEDEPMGREMLAGLSDETLRVRFFAVREITRDLLIRFCNIDYDREIAIVAEIRKDDKKILIAAARLVSEPDSTKAEFAILVHDNYQGMGLGVKMIDILIGIGQDKGLDRIYGTVLNENQRMLELCRRLGFRIESRSDGVSTVTSPLLRA